MLPTGIIILWSGAIANIPAGYTLCDGNNGTPDLRDRFVMGAGDTYNPDDTGGDVNHTHNFTGDGHFHPFDAGSGLQVGSGIANVTTPTAVTGTTNNASNMPEFYALAYIMKT